MTVSTSTGGQIEKWAYDVATWINNNRAYQPFWKEVSASIALEKAWNLVVVDTTGGAVTLTLPSGMPQGWKIIVQDNGNGGTNAVTVQRAGSETVNGTTSVAISADYGRLTLYCDGEGAWYAA